MYVSLKKLKKLRRWEEKQKQKERENKEKNLQTVAQTRVRR